MRASEFLIEYKLKVSKDADGVAIRATAGGKQLGHAEFFFDDEGRLDPQTVWVDERYHGQGIARDMYDHLKSLGYTIVRSWDQTDAGKGFWDKHRGEDARIWESLAQTRLPRSIEQFLYSLTPSDVGVEEIGPYRIHFEGFTDDCKSSSDYCADPEAVYQEVFDDFIQREGGGKPIASGMVGDEDYPVLYSVFLKQMDENFADGKKPGRKGLAKRVGVNCKQSISKLRNIAAHSSGERQRMAHWCANMKSGKKKK